MTLAEFRSRLRRAWVVLRTDIDPAALATHQEAEKILWHERDQAAVWGNDLYQTLMFIKMVMLDFDSYLPILKDTEVGKWESFGRLEKALEALHNLVDQVPELPVWPDTLPKGNSLGTTK